MKTSKKSVIFIVGPTSSGKTRVASGLADEVFGEIISCDSMQVYKDMDIITQAPPKEYLLKTEHYLVRVLPPEEEFSAAHFLQEAQECIEIIIAKGKTPIFAGGTGLYVKSLLDGLFASPPKSIEIRERLEDIAEAKGTEYLHAKLKKIDDEAAGKIHPNDLRRIVRALEVYELTGKTISEKKAETEGFSEKYDCKIFGLKLPRTLLYERIERAVDDMFEKGIIEEVKSLKGRDLSITAEKALGIKEISNYIDGKTGLKEAKDEIKKNTRRYAKRQMTWFRSDKRIEWINADQPIEKIIEEIIQVL